jgi:biotin synthase-like enzyme
MLLQEMNDIKKYFEESGSEFFKWVIPKSKKDERYGTLREINDKDIINLKDGKGVC